MTRQSDFRIVLDRGELRLRWVPTLRLYTGDVRADAEFLTLVSPDGSRYIEAVDIDDLLERVGLEYGLTVAVMGGPDGE